MCVYTYIYSYVHRYIHICVYKYVYARAFILMSVHDVYICVYLHIHIYLIICCSTTRTHYVRSRFLLSHLENFKTMA